ncbi:MAG: hypothetical protein ACD_57C00391G0002 [uncultured bacterium]|uniref:Glycosyltransferase RgtA/B/C/D-like domain-containing protein n=1 Tax=Candidatus Woesebacteria bacterium RIFCSPHIGHO2_12_FULL_41_24 TaxID=1802510 RepID=A0A1F8ASN7_9BACT|nr:MAG: hypothetical protein ACD_57C00391G0002 [uncultured bacterium]OGM12929.1 MAG: hypothetical protein A2W15_01025 [Candidatus Woesebacteria bacterium RBG_16_41_13]OGM28769.1 MAG: hypothetical protein A2873_01730 [Candidatus Woesebacteria bacterium RIFCSPHIGHO2_01_FULL_42_80]OGM34969.1 MAG: hypothetical protein A3D84_06075 [Candidatus Woesebacteria bacterium RIFCSPHIGHO2_02_FULL_42_20]OGM54660.1 MAG: hypothetical protein A3E44_02435 [Candidatus Woesebacteria bacterium RIFCSPHIGHO2_12_FULL_41
MKIIINEHKIKVNWLAVFYLLVFLGFTTYIVRDLAYNTAFVDEAIYATIGEEVLRGIFWEKALFWMGGSYIYPVISALLNRYMGLAGVRLFSTVCVLVTGIIAGKIGKRLGGKVIEVISLFIFLFSSVTLDIAQMGTYDALSLTLLAMSFYSAILIRKNTNINSGLLILFSATTFALSVLTKYFAIVFILPLFLVAFFKKGLLNSRGAFLWLLFSGLILGFYLLKFHSEIFSYINGPYSNQPSSTLEISKEIIGNLNISILGALLAFILAVKGKLGDKNKLILIIFMAGLLPIIYHIGATNIRSLWKHMVITSFFWVPLSAYSLSKIAGFIKKAGGKSTTLANLSQIVFTLLLLGVVTSVWVNFSRHWRFQRSWPSSTKALTYLAKNRSSADKIFAEGSAIYKYHLFDGFEDPSSWSSTWYLEYESLQGVEAMKVAINDQAFDFIILNNYFTPDVNKEILPTIYHRYKITLTDTYKVSGVYDETTIVWEPK